MASPLTIGPCWYCQDYSERGRLRDRGRAVPQFSFLFICSQFNLSEAGSHHPRSGRSAIACEITDPEFR